jgi:hypothetical protein
MLGVARRPQPALGGSLTRPRPMMPVLFSHLGRSLMRTSILDTGADDTVLPDWIASALGVQLAGAEERQIGLAGRTPLRCRYASLEIEISDGATETYRWTAIVGFVDGAPLPRPLLGHAGSLQYFDVEFRGADLEFVILPNHTAGACVLVPGRQRSAAADRADRSDELRRRRGRSGSAPSRAAALRRTAVEEAWTIDADDPMGLEATFQRKPSPPRCRRA